MRLYDGLIASLSCGLFIALFLILYQPFGTYEFSTAGKYWFLSGYGLIVFVVMFVSWLAALYLIKPVNSSAPQVIIPIVMISFLIALLATFLYKQWYFEQDIQVLTLLDYLPFGLATGLIPIVGIIVWQLKKAKAEAETKIVLADANGKDMLSLTPLDLFCLKASDNYIEVHYQLGDTIETTLLRNTLTAAEDTLKGHSDLMRCHRSYLVNLRKVKKTSGHKDRLSLHLTEALIIPVSRQYTDGVLKQLAEY